MESIKFTFPINQQLNCSSNNSVFVDDVQFLLNLTKIFLEKTNNKPAVSAETITSFGNELIPLLSTPIDNQKGDLFNDTKYSQIFTGEHSEKFIEIFQLIQSLFFQSSRLDTYPTLELIDQGVRQEDQEQFLHDLRLLHNKLLILDKAIKNRE